MAYTYISYDKYSEAQLLVYYCAAYVDNDPCFFAHVFFPVPGFEFRKSTEKKVSNAQKKSFKKLILKLLSYTQCYPMDVICWFACTSSVYNVN